MTTCCLTKQNCLTTSRLYVHIRLNLIDYMPVDEWRQHKVKLSY